MCIICTDKGCFSSNKEVGSEEWKEELMKLGMSLHDIQLMENFVKEIKYK